LGLDIEVAAAVAPDLWSRVATPRELAWLEAQAPSERRRLATVLFSAKECFYKARQNMSPSCQTAVTNAGYDAPINASAATTQVALGSTDLINSLQGVEQAGPDLSAARLRQMAVQSLNDPSRTNRMNRAPLAERLDKLAQLTIAIQFDFNSARIRPSSFAAVGLMADALYHPYLQGYRFLIVGHTDAKGNREYNLKLSQQRADAIREALINPFGISPARIESVGRAPDKRPVRLKPGDQAERRFCQPSAKRREFVLDAGRHLRIDVAREHAVTLQVAHGGREHPLGYPRNAALQIREPPPKRRPAFEDEDHQQAPLVSDAAQHVSKVAVVVAVLLRDPLRLLRHRLVPSSGLRRPTECLIGIRRRLSIHS